LGGKLVVECPVSLFENRVGGLLDGDWRWIGLVRTPVVSASLLPEGPKRLEPVKVIEVLSVPMFGETPAASP